MKLIDFSEFKPFQNIKRKMGIPEECDVVYDGLTKFDKLEFDAHEWQEIVSGRGIDVSLNQLTVCDDGTLEYKGQKMILYIRDQYSYKSEYKFHVSWCSTLRDMNKNNRLNRYVVSRRTDGIFLVNIMDKSSQQIILSNRESRMKVCKCCLSKLNYEGYKTTYDKFNKEKIYNDFKIDKFLSEYDTKFKHIPKHNDLTSPINQYPKNWNDIARKYKEYKNWKCQECGRDCTYEKGFLDVHHIDGDKSNVNYYNLQALCKECHANKPYHGHYKNLLKYK